jgi:hypothetical protein
MSRRTPLAALVALTAALAPAVPVASASAAPRAQALHASTIGLPGGPLVPGSPPCVFLIHQIQFALLVHNPALANFWSNVFIYSGCGGAAI